MSVLSLESQHKVLSHACISLAENQKEITIDALKKILEATKASIQDYLIEVYVKSFKKIDYKVLKEAVLNAGIGGGSSGSGAKPEATEEKKEEVKEESESSESL